MKHWETAQSNMTRENNGLAPDVDALVKSLQSSDGVHGARMMGGGFGGMILVLVENESVLPNMKQWFRRPGFVEDSSNVEDALAPYPKILCCRVNINLS